MSTSRRSLSRVVVVLGVGALLLGVPGVAQATGGGKGCVAGAPGVGDTYYPATATAATTSATTTSTSRTTRRPTGWTAARRSARATQSLCSFNLDLVGLDVHRVEVDGRRADLEPQRPGAHGHAAPAAARTGGVPRVVVRYDGVPVEFVLPGFDIRTGFMATSDGATVVGQPEVAAAWFPVNDHPIDKAAYTFEVTVPKGYEVVANGFLVDVDSHRGSRRSGSGTPASRWPRIWRRSTSASGTSTAGGRRAGCPSETPSTPSITGGLRAEIDSSLARQGEILDLLEASVRAATRSAPSARSCDGQDDLFFALETQTRPVYSKLFWLDHERQPGQRRLRRRPRARPPVVRRRRRARALAGHLAQRGLRDLRRVAVGGARGPRTPQEIFQASYDAIPADDPFWSVAIGDPGVDQLFDDAVYFRGAMTLQALRNEVGDDGVLGDHPWLGAPARAAATGRRPSSSPSPSGSPGGSSTTSSTTWLFTAAKPATAPFAARPDTRSRSPQRGGRVESRRDEEVVAAAPLSQQRSARAPSADVRTPAFPGGSRRVRAGPQALVRVVHSRRARSFGRAACLRAKAQATRAAHARPVRGRARCVQFGGAPAGSTALTGRRG